VSGRPRLLFVSPRFLFPTDSGGKIRTAQVLRGMRGGRFEVTLVAPAPPSAGTRFAAELDAVCDRFGGWPDRRGSRWFSLMRAASLLSRLPVSVATDQSNEAQALVTAELSRQPDVIVFDFVHAAVLAPPATGNAVSILFTHNVEAEIYERHALAARGWYRRALWKDQSRKMRRFEREALRRFDAVVAVSERDAKYFREHLGARTVHVIPTGVDLDYYGYAPSADADRIVFTGSMDWAANVDAIAFFMDEVWPLIVAAVPTASMTVVGKDPPQRLVEAARSRRLRWTFTGFVDDVRPYVHGAAVYTVPLRVGGGTRLKIYEAMALGCPVVSTAIGVEGLPLEAGTHYLQAESAGDLAVAVVELLHNRATRDELSARARAYVERHCSFRKVAAVFEDICTQAAAARVSGPRCTATMSDLSRQKPARKTSGR
jgi:glycosyltransferase involved in cell wall biosynthesis